MNDAHRLDVLVTYAEGLGWHVEMGDADDDQMWPEQRLVIISRHQTRRGQVYALLHELGHVLQDAGGHTLGGERLFKQGDWAELESEIDAWVRGWGIAQRLGLGLPLRGYQREARAALRTYLPGLPQQTP